MSRCVSVWFQIGVAWGVEQEGIKKMFTLNLNSFKYDAHSNALSQYSGFFGPWLLLNAFSVQPLDVTIFTDSQYESFNHKKGALSKKLTSVLSTHFKL